MLCIDVAKRDVTFPSCCFPAGTVVCSMSSYALGLSSLFLSIYHSFDSVTCLVFHCYCSQHVAGLFHHALFLVMTSLLLDVLLLRELGLLQDNVAKVAQLIHQQTLDADSSKGLTKGLTNGPTPVYA